MTAQVLGEGDFRYELVEGWGTLPDGWILPDVCSVAIDADDNVYLAGRGEHPVIVLDRDGNFLRSFGEGVIRSAHSLRFGPDGMLYCADERDHAVRKFTPQGELLLTLGTPGKASAYMGGKPFNGCNDVAVAANGDIFVSDGYGNARIHKFSADGKHLASWGGPGMEPGHFNLIHNIWIDPKGRLVETDREGHRVQVFDLEGNVLAQWHGFHRPNGLTMIPGSNSVFVITEIGPVLAFNRHCANLGPRLSVVDGEGKILARIGTKGPGLADDEFFAPHGIAVDSQGSIYVGEVARSTWPDYFQGPPPAGLRSFRKLRKAA